MFTDHLQGAKSWSGLCENPTLLAQLVHLSERLAMGSAGRQAVGAMGAVTFYQCLPGAPQVSNKCQGNQPMSAQVGDSIATHPKRCLIL